MSIEFVPVVMYILCDLSIKIAGMFEYESFSWDETAQMDHRTQANRNEDDVDYNNDDDEDDMMMMILMMMIIMMMMMMTTTTTMMMRMRMMMSIIVTCAANRRG